MSSYINLIGFEYKKLLRKKSNLIILFIAIILTPFIYLGPLMGNHYIEGEVAQSKYEYMKEDRKIARNLTGRVIDSELLKETLKAYQEIGSVEGSYITSKGYPKIAGPYSYMLYMMRGAFECSSLEELQKLTSSQIETFYTARQEKIAKGIEKISMSKTEKEAAVAISHKVSTPFTFAYTHGYQSFFANMYSIGILLCVVCAVCLSPIFAGEYNTNMDSLILTSKYGKNRVIVAKLFVGITFAAFLTILLTIISYLTLSLSWGMDGGKYPFQLFHPLSILPFSMWQVAFFYVVLILFATLFSAVLALVLSAKLKSEYHVVVIMFLLIIAPIFLSVPQNPLWIFHLSNLLPIKMLDLSNLDSILTMNVFGLVLQPYQFIILFTIIASAVLLPFAYQSFNKHQVSC